MTRLSSWHQFEENVLQIEFLHQYFGPLLGKTQRKLET